jgi:protein involved in polysaccharide export with SLBB domain
LNFLKLAFIICISLMICIPSVKAQSIQNLSKVKVDNLSDDQIRQIQRQIESTGVPDSQLEQTAVARGMDPVEVQKLRARINRLKNTNGTIGNDTTAQPGRKGPATPVNETPPEGKSLIFGADLFLNSKLTFEPNLKLATPKNYVIGPDDQIQIDLTGDNEAHYNLTVSPEGAIRIEYAGIIAVNGLTVEQATAKIRSRLAQTYPAIRSGRTTLSVGIGNIRSIKVTLLGEVTKPGSYTLSSLATVFNALYASGGPTQNGSFREIEVIRNGSIIARLDIYDFLLKGYQTNNIRLQDQDIIHIPVYKVHAQLTGEVKHPAIFEVLSKETLTDIIRFAGGFTDVAYTAKIKVLENTNKERRVSDISATDYSSFIPKNGDKFIVDSILNRFENRVTIKGAVFRPGQFELKPGLTLSGLINQADGIKEDAFLGRANILRLLPDNTSQLISFNVKEILDKTAPDIPLQREDIVTISSIFELKDEYKVTINGEVRLGGTYNYAEGMSLQDLVVLAGGFSEGASSKQIEIARRVTNSDINSFNAKTAEIYRVDVDKMLTFAGEKFILQPFDIVTVRNNTGYSEQRQVYVEGEVLHPGNYTIEAKSERISDLITRSGGLTPLAYPPGASLRRASVEAGTGKNKINKAEDDRLKLQNLQRLQADAKDSSNVNLQHVLSDNNTVGIDLVQIMKAPGSNIDLILKEGDILRVPQQLQTVKINGEVLYPVTAVYENGSGFKHYISQAGGFTQRALRRSAYVVYANGSVDNVKKFLFFTSYPDIKPGSEIFVPKKADTKATSALEWVSISTAIASLGAIILGILKL